MKRAGVVIISLIAVVTAAFFWASNAERRNANRIIAAIEEYRKKYDRLPNPSDQALLKSLGFEHRGVWKPYYEVGEKGFYQIMILEGSGGRYWTYDSFSRTWRKEYPDKDYEP